MRTMCKQTDAPTVSTTAKVVSTPATPRVLSAVELAAVTGAGIIVGNKAGVFIGT